jgi:hypothetical protein
MKFKEQFGQLKSIVLRSLGREAFEKDAEGKLVLTADDEEKLKSSFTPVFLDKFKKGLEVEDATKEQEQAMDQLKADNGVQIADMTEKVNAATRRADELAASNKQLKETVDALSNTAEEDSPAEVIVSKQGGDEKVIAWHGVKPNSKHFHHQMAMEYLKGDSGKAMGSSSSSFSSSAIPGMAGNTINVDEIASEFGTYLSNAGIRLDILQKLTQKTESQNFMTTKMAITEWRASTAAITSVVQQFVAKWTPLGQSKFSPLTIKNRHHKVNLPITPDDINDSWLSYLYDEQVSPEQMPVTRYIIEKLLRPKIDSDIELLMIATGVYEELGDVSEGQAGQATGNNMDGYVTILKKQKAIQGTKINFIDPTDSIPAFTGITADNVVDVIEAYSDWVEDKAPLYAKAGMNIFIDPKIHKLLKRKYRELYPTTKNEDKTQDKPDFSNLNFVPLNAMRGTGTFFSTPQENFIRLIHKNAAGGETKIWLQTENYTVKVFAEFWLGTGFATAELVFAYVPDSAGSGA